MKHSEYLLVLQLQSSHADEAHKNLKGGWATPANSRLSMRSGWREFLCVFDSLFWLSSQLFIDNDWHESCSSRKIPVYNPTTGELLCEVEEADSVSKVYYTSSVYHICFNKYKWFRIWSVSLLCSEEVECFFIPVKGLRSHLSQKPKQPCKDDIVLLNSNLS